MGGGGGPTQQNVKTETSNLPDYAKPYYTGLMERSQGLLSQDYTPYSAERIAGFTPGQEQTQQAIMNQQQPGQFGMGAGLASAAGLGSLSASQYSAGQFGAQQIRPQQVRSQQVGAQNVNAGPLNYFQMQGPGSFNDSGTAQSYMSPYQQNVLDVQKGEAVRDAQKAQLSDDLGAARQGTYGGSRQLLASLERERNLNQNLSNIQATGMQSAYDRAQQQFNTEQTAQQQAGSQNLNAALGVQQLGANQNLQAQQANQQAGLQAQTTNAGNWLQSQQLNQQAGMQAQQQNAANQLQAQQMGEQSRQFGAQQGLAGLAQAGQMAQTLGNLGQMQSQTDIARLNQQQQVGATQQALNQQYLDTQYQDFLRQRDYPLEMLQQYSSLLRGVPVTPTSTTTTYGQAPSAASQVLGTGLGALGMYKTLAG